MAGAVLGAGIAVLAAGLGMARAEQALTPIPFNAFITANGLDWAWAGPCPARSNTCGAIDLSFQAQFGWRLPSAVEILTQRPTAFDFVFSGANVPNGGTSREGASFRTGAPIGDAACAAPYFNATWAHCDWLDGMFGNWDGLPSANPNSELLVVRPAASLPMSGNFRGQDKPHG